MLTEAPAYILDADWSDGDDEVDAQPVEDLSQSAYACNAQCLWRLTYHSDSSAEIAGPIAIDLRRVEKADRHEGLAKEEVEQEDEGDGDTICGLTANTKTNCGNGEA
jgi:hypothetical protein